MSAVLTISPWLEGCFSAASAFLPGAWLQAFRANQFEQFLQRGLPSRKEESWKYTSVSHLEKTNFSFPAIAEPAEMNIKKSFDSAILLVFKNGHFSKEMSDVRLLPPDVVLLPLSLAVQTHKSMIESYLLQPFDSQQHPFACLNAALMTEGTFLQIPKNCTVPYPIHLLFLNTGENNFISCPRNIILVHENAKATLVEEHTANQAENYFTNVVTELHAHNNACLNYYKLQNEHCSATHIANVRVQQKQDSQVNTFFMDGGSRLAREDLTIQLHERGGVCHMTGLYLLKQDGQHIDNHVYVDHAAAHCTSAMLYKGILDKKSQAVFNGKVYARQGAQKTHSQQANHNLLLSPEAEVNTKPELEIYEDDVKCAHGATVGQLDTDSLFYLRSRGIEKKEALTLLAEAFASELMQKIDNIAIRNYVEQQARQYADL